MAPQGERLAWHDELGQIQIITVATGETVTLSPALSGRGVVSSAWSPDGQKLAYTQASYRKPAYEGAVGGFREPHLAVVNADGRDNHSIDYYQDSMGESVIISWFTWDNTGQMLAAIAISYKCSDFNGQCPYHIILINSNDGQVYELFSESLISHPIIWDSTNNRLTFGCYLSKLERGGQCAADFLVQ